MSLESEQIKIYETGIRSLLGNIKTPPDSTGALGEKEVGGVLASFVIPEIQSGVPWMIQLPNKAIPYRKLLSMLKNLYKNIIRGTEKEYKQTLKVYHIGVKRIRDDVVELIRKSYLKYLESKFPSVSGDHYTFHRFRKMDYEQYTLVKLFKTLSRYISVLQSDSGVLPALKTYTEKELNKLTKLKPRFPNPSDSDETGMSRGVEDKRFKESMDTFFSGVGDASDPFRHQDLIEAYMTYHNYMGDSVMRSNGLLLHHGLGSGKTRTSTKVLGACIYDTHRHFTQQQQQPNPSSDTDKDSDANQSLTMNPAYLRNTFLLIPAALRVDPWYSHLMKKEYGSPFQESMDTEYDLPLHNIFVVHYNYGMRNKPASITSFLDKYKTYMEHSFIIVDEVHNVLNSIPDVEAGIRAKKGLGASSKDGGSSSSYMIDTDTGDPKKITFYHVLYKTLHDIKHKKLLLLSGTPISKYVSEYIYALRLVKGKEFFDKLDKRFFSSEKNKDGSIFDYTVSPGEGIPSYMDTLFTKDSVTQTYKLSMNVLESIQYTGKAIQDPSTLSTVLTVPKHLQTPITSEQSFQEWKQRMVESYNKTHTQSNVFMTNFLSLTSGLISYVKGDEIDKIKRVYQFIPMTELQLKMYNAVQSTQIMELPEKKRMEVLMSQLRRKQAVNARGTLKYELTAEIDKLTRQQRLPGSGTKNSGILTSLLELCNIAYVNDDLDNSKGTGRTRPHDIMVSVGDGNRHQFETLTDFKTHLRTSGRSLTLDNLPIYSNKLAQLLVNLENNPDENTPYPQTMGSDSSREPVPISRCHVVYSPYVNLYGIECIRQMFEDTEFYEEYLPVKKGGFVFPDTKTPRFAVYQPGIQSIFNDPRNAFGEYIKVLLISDNAKEGVSFKNVVYEHVFNFQWNPNKIDQIIGRGIRQNSHRDLENRDVWDDSSKVTVFYYCSIYSKRYPKCMDLEVGRIGKQKYELIQYFYETIHQNSIDSVRLDLEPDVFLSSQQKKMKR